MPRDKKAVVQLKVRMREPLRAKLERMAKARGISLNSLIVERLESSAEHAGLLREVLAIAYGPEWADFLAGAHANGVLTLRDQHKDAIRAILNQFIDSLPSEPKQ